LSPAGTFDSPDKTRVWYTAKSEIICWIESAKEFAVVPWLLGSGPVVYRYAQATPWQSSLFV
jgi:hypothetical protein